VNKLTRFFSIAFFSATFIYTGPLWSETMYIDDNLWVPLRSGAGTSYRIIHKGIKSGTELEILETSKDTGYSQVQTPDGMTGYLPTRYLTAQPIARTRLIKANQRTATLEKENTTLNSRLAKLLKEHNTLSEKHGQTAEQLDKNNQELANIKSISADALNLDRRNRELRENNEQLRNEMELLQTENRRLKEKTDSNMMLIGGGLVTLGVIITLLVPMLKPSKKGDSWA